MTDASSTAALLAVAAFGLGGSRHTAPTDPLLDSAWPTFLSDVIEHRLIGLLSAMVQEEAFPVAEWQEEQVENEIVRAMTTAVALEANLLKLASLLESASMEYRVLKGSAHAHLDYRDPSLRAFNDVDLLVHSHDYDAAVAMLTKAGCERRYPEPRPGFDRRFGKGTSLRAAEGYEIDLHRAIVFGPFGQSVNEQDLFHDPRSFAVGGRMLTALSDDARFLHACFHALLGDSPPRLLSVRDVAEIALRGGYDHRKVRRLAADWRSEAVLSGAVTQAWTILDLSDELPISTWAAHMHPNPQQLRWLRYYNGSPGYAAHAYATLGAIRGPQAKASYLRSMIFPRRDYLTGRHRGPVRRWVYAARSIGRARSKTNELASNQTRTGRRWTQT